MNSAAVSISYDEVPYESGPFAQTHPDRLAVVATLQGLTPPPLARCRVLELGCAAGSNLLPMATTMPDACFTGIDLSARQIADGQRTVDALGLKNVTLRHQDLLAFDDRGPFDYILCHGVYSWVAPAVQDRILALCSERLSPNGIAYVSYNTYPGWTTRGAVRDLLLYHAGHLREPRARVRQARALLDFMAQVLPARAPLRADVESFQKANDSYLVHEPLEQFNQPVLFHEFVQRASVHGLRYLGEAETAGVIEATLRDEQRAALQRLAPDPVRREQYLDFLRNRTFRQTLLCRATLAAAAPPGPAGMTRLHLRSLALPVAARAPSAAPMDFMCGTFTVTVRDAMLQAALLCLGDAIPHSLPFDELLQRARQRLGDKAPPQPRARLAQALLQLYRTHSAAVIQFLLQPPVLPAESSERPVATPLARHQARARAAVTNPYHETVALGAPALHLLPLLDGSRDRAALLDALATAVQGGQLALSERAPRGGDARSLRPALERILKRLHRAALLTA